MAKYNYTTAKELISRAEAHADHAPEATKIIMRELIDHLEAFIEYNDWNQNQYGLAGILVDKLEDDIKKLREELYKGQG